MWIALCTYTVYTYLFGHVSYATVNTGIVSTKCVCVCLCMYVSVYVLQSSDALQLRIKLDKANGCTIERPTCVFSTHFDLWLLNIFHRKNFKQNLWRKIKHLCFVWFTFAMSLSRYSKSDRIITLGMHIRLGLWQVEKLLFHNSNFIIRRFLLWRKIRLWWTLIFFFRLYLLLRFSVPTDRLASRSRTWKV